MEAEKDEAIKRAISVLCSLELEPIVEMVIACVAPEIYEVRCVDGAVRFRRRKGDPGQGFEILEIEGRNPLEKQDPSYLHRFEEQKSNPHPKRTVNSYPFAFESIAQVFDHRDAPDLIVLHSAAHNWEERGGHLGEHGSLDAVQARAPLILWGPGSRALGALDRAVRLVDVAPTILAALSGPSAPLDYFDGRVQRDLITDTDPPERVLMVLFDGTNASVLYHYAQAGELPSYSFLMNEGTWLKWGAFASLPTVTLANHTTLVTGLHPGHHGILHNAWRKRDDLSRIVTESPATWHTAMNYLKEGVLTLHERIKMASKGEVLTASINEPADKGADYSTFEYFRKNRAHELLPDLNKPPARCDLDLAQRYPTYKVGSYADEASLNQFLKIFRKREELQGLPVFTFLGFTATDAAFHAGGPFSEVAKRALKDSDERLSIVLEVLQEASLLENTLIAVVADHGMELTDPSVKGDWNEALRKAGLSFEEESGFIYLKN